MAEETIDPLGEVYTGRDRTGAAFVIPGSRTNTTDLFISELNKREAQKKGMKDSLLKLDNLDKIKPWDRDVPYLQQKRDKFVNYVSGLYAQGIVPEKHPEIYGQIIKMKDELMMEAAKSSSDRELGDFYDKELILNGEKYDPQSKPNFEKWKSEGVGRGDNYGIAKLPDTNYMDSLNKMSAGRKYEVEGQTTSGLNGDSPYYTNTKTKRFDEVAARSDAKSYIRQLKPSEHDQLLQDATKDLKADGIDITGLKPDDMVSLDANNPNAPKSRVGDLLDNAAENIYINPKRFKEEAMPTPHFKPTDIRKKDWEVTGNTLRDDKNVWTYEIDGNGKETISAKKISKGENAEFNWSDGKGGVIRGKFSGFQTLPDGQLAPYIDTKVTTTVLVDKNSGAVVTQKKYDAMDEFEKKSVKPKISTETERVTVPPNEANAAILTDEYGQSNPYDIRAQITGSVEKGKGARTGVSTNTVGRGSAAKEKTVEVTADQLSAKATSKKMTPDQYIAAMSANGITIKLKK